MKPQVKKWALFTLRWGIAIAGIWYVLSQMTWHDTVTVLDAHNRPYAAVLVPSPDGKLADERSMEFAIAGNPSVRRDRVVNKPDRKQVAIHTPTGDLQVPLLGLDLTADLKRANRLLVEDPGSKDGHWVAPQDVVGGYQIRVPYPRVEAGLKSLVAHARLPLLWASILVFPLTFLITSVRWNALLKALDIHLSNTRTFVLNMVGAFYNSFMPGSTGGDVLKAYYASKQTLHRTRAVMSVFVDRVLGLLALVVLGGIMASWQYLIIHNASDPVARKCGQVALGSLVVVVGTALGLVVFYTPVLRRFCGLDYIIDRLPMQKQVRNAIIVMDIYRRRPGLVLSALVMTFPVHITVVISAMLAGEAFGLGDVIPPRYYFVAVPVIVLVGSVPISPQGAGVMEYFAIILTNKYGATVSQAFVLANCIRVVQMLWNLVGGVFVLRGGYHKPAETERTADADESPAA